MMSMLIIHILHSHSISPFFFNDTPTTEIYTLSLHDALPICPRGSCCTKASRVILPSLIVRCVSTIGRPGCSTHTRRSEEHTSELQSQSNLVCRLLLEKKKKTRENASYTIISVMINMYLTTI